MMESSNLWFVLIQKGRGGDDEYHHRRYIGKMVLMGWKHPLNTMTRRGVQISAFPEVSFVFRY